MKPAPIDYVGENKLIFLDKDIKNGFRIENVCPRYEGDTEDVDFVEYSKYEEQKMENTTSLIKEKAGNKCVFCGSEKTSSTSS